MKASEFLKENGFSQDTIEKILQCGKVILLKKGEFFLRENQVSHNIGFVLNGLLYSYYTDREAVKRIYRFYYQPRYHLMLDYESFLENTPSSLNIEVLEDAEVFLLERSVFDKICLEVPEFARLYQQEISQMLVRTLRIIRVFQSGSTHERLRLLKQTCPELFLKVPYSYLASYLGIHRNTFTELLKKV
ncbi:Crp/Fnr family transcriptional regulator [Capnocytophaga canimorsus]|uniref:Crp/Fnr family transcriptional regulator n=1 Tax=Capnocytophaga canimorsus TaxID=28188 RepID=UPI0037CE710D